MDAAKKREWAAKRFDRNRDARVDALGAGLAPGVPMAATFEDGELKFFVEGVPVIDHIFLSDAEGRFIVAQWKLLASAFSVTEKTDGKKLANALRKIGETENAALVDQIINLQQQVSTIDAEINRIEPELNALTYRLYELTPNEIRLVESG